MEPMSEQPDRERIVADEERIGALLRAVEAPAPAALHARIAARNAPRSAWRLPIPALGMAIAGAAAGAAVALIIVLGSGGTTAPTVLRVSQVALAAPTASAPHTLIAKGTSIRFPDWSARGLPSVGVRNEQLGGRAVTAEFYRSASAGTLGYAIVSGAPLSDGGGSPVFWHGESYDLISSGGMPLVAWVQDGHTCVIASRSAPAATLLELAEAESAAV